MPSSIFGLLGFTMYVIGFGLGLVWSVSSVRLTLRVMSLRICLMWTYCWLTTSSLARASMMRQLCSYGTVLEKITCMFCAG